MPNMFGLRNLFLTTTLILVLFASFACTGDDDASNATSPGNRSTDEQYLRAVCIGLTNFSDAIVSKTSSAEIAAVIKAYVASMKELSPPVDLDKFHRDYVKYLQSAVDEPTSLLTRTPPLPPDAVRKRIASKERGVPECRDATFFSTRSAQP